MRTILQWFFDAWVWGSAIIFAVLLLAATLALIWFTRPGPSVEAPATAVINVILAPSDTPAPPTVTPTPPASPTPQPAGDIPPAPAPGVINLGALVQISGTEGDGLRLRADPGLYGEVRLLGAEAEVFQVSDGPREVDGFTWWLLVSPSDAARTGWAVSNYLALVQNP